MADIRLKSFRQQAYKHPVGSLDYVTKEDGITAADGDVLKVFKLAEGMVISDILFESSGSLGTGSTVQITDAAGTTVIASGGTGIQRMYDNLGLKLPMDADLEILVGTGSGLNDSTFACSVKGHIVIQ